MISVQNHQQRLSGNKLLLALGLVLTLGACSPKVGVLKSPDHRVGTVGSTPKDTKTEETEPGLTAEESAISRKLQANNIALVLPFQLDRVSKHAISKEDVERSAIALDFYQGFQLGLDELAAAGTYFALNVMDSRDSESHIATLVKSGKANESALVVGPVFPKEITAFGANSQNRRALQVNPLAATKASEFNLSNLVSLTPSIDVHMNAIAEKVAKDYRKDDVVVVYKTNDNDCRQFLEGFTTAVRKANSAVQLVVVSSIGELDDALKLTATNRIVTGTTDRNTLRILLSNMTAKSTEEYYSFKLYGHPLWDRIDFDGFESFSSFDPTITSESHLKTWSTAAKAFNDIYRKRFGVSASDFAYKGYDAARYFGQLVDKHNEDYADHITKQRFEGLFSTYDFEFNDHWGYTNKGVAYKIYKGSSFQLN